MGKTKSSQPSTKSDWKLFGGRIPPELAKAVRILSIKEDNSVQDLMIEALTDVLMKHGEKPPRK
jgi:predicted HicB family RNase H-like nuclease